MKAFVVLLAGLSLSSPVLAQTGAASTGGEAAAQRTENGTSAATDDTANAERLICRRIASSESRMSRQRLCLTSAQWRERSRQDNNLD
ncbi:MAG: hypothetical protein ACXWUP_02770 [Allosphingosinicella sp.]